MKKAFLHAIPLDIGNGDTHVLQQESCILRIIVGDAFEKIIENRCGHFLFIPVAGDLDCTADLR